VDSKLDKTCVWFFGSISVVFFYLQRYIILFWSISNAEQYSEIKNAKKMLIFFENLKFWKKNSVAQFSKIFFLHLFISLYLSQIVAKFEGGNFRFKEDIQP